MSTIDAPDVHVDFLKRRKRRLVRLVAIILVVIIVAHVSGLSESFSADRIRTEVAAAGNWGIVMYLLICILRDLHQVPGFVVVSAGVLAFGELHGGVLAFLGLMASTILTFLLVRRVGGGPQYRVERPGIKRMMVHLQARPILSVCLMRVCFGSSTIINVPLALSPVRFRDYLIGSALGLIPPTLAAMGVMSLLFGP